MRSPAIGLDFGTTNSSIAITSPAGTELIRFAGGTPSFRSLLYLEHHQSAGRSSTEAFTGPAAIDRYLNRHAAQVERPGRLIQSLKSYLAVRNLNGTEVFGRRYTLEDLISRILIDLRAAASSRLGVEVTDAIVGRPVNFVSAEAESDNTFALDRLSGALRMAGFKHIEFLPEPVAAAYTYEASLDHDELVLIGDFGGGTSDFTLIRVGPSARALPAEERILGTSGVGLAGDALDAKLVRMMLQGLSLTVTSFRATVLIPGTFTYVRCTAGSPNSSTPCLSASAGTEDATTPTFTDGPRGEGEVVGVDIGFPAGEVAANEQVDYRWTVGRAFSPDPLPLGLAIGLLVLGGLALLLAHRRRGTDAAYTGEPARVGEFVPVGPGQSEFRVVGDVRPGQVGTVADERVDPIDVTATLVDLAVRGHLLITELPRTSGFARTDWTLTRIGDGAGLRPFEQRLLEGIAPDGEPVRVSEVGGRVGQAIGGVQDALYDEMVENGWYARRPDVTRNRGTQLAFGVLIAAVVVTALLAAFTTFGLIGLALVILGLGLVFVAQEMPSRTAKGVALLTGLGALRSDLLTHPTDQMPPGRAVEELSEVLPYAIVLGGTERWLDALVATDTDADPDSEDLTWYHGPRDWHLRDLPDSLRNFTTTVSGTLFTR